MLLSGVSQKHGGSSEVIEFLPSGTAQCLYRKDKKSHRKTGVFFRGMKILKPWGKWCSPRGDTFSQKNGGLLQRNYDLKRQWGKHTGLPGG